jgi:sugar lactone lactonase YvrE
VVTSVGHSPNVLGARRAAADAHPMAVAARARRAAMIGFALLAVVSPGQAAAALTPGELIVADARADGGGALFEVDPSSGAETLLSSNQMAINASNQLFNYPFTLALDPDGDILVANTGNMGGSCSGGCGGVIEVDPSTGAETVLSSNAMAINASSQYFNQPVGIAVAPDGTIYVSDWGDCDGCGRIIKVDPTTGKETLISSNSMAVNASSQYYAYLQGIAIDASGDILAADPMAFGSGGGIIEVDPTTGKETELSSNLQAVNASSQYFHNPSQLTVAADGDIYVADWCQTTSCGGVVEVDPTSGHETLLSSNSMAVNASSQYFDQPTAVAIDGSGRLVVVEEAGLGGSCSGGCGGVLYVDPTSGAETELSSNAMAVNAANQDYVEPFDAVVVPAGSSGSGGGGNSGSGGGGNSGSGPGSPGPASPGAGSPTPTATATTTEPAALGALAESRSRWREGARGTVFSFTLRQPVTVTLSFSRLRAGRRFHGGCRAPTPRTRRRPACVLASAVGTVIVAGHAGTNTVDFTGRMASGETLGSGSYEVTASAAGTPAGALLRFTIRS